MNWVSSNIDRIVDLTISHTWLTLVPTILGLIVALPLGWWAHRSGRGYAAIVGTAGLLYTIPSLALFIILPAVLGTKILDPINIVVALTLYTVALLVRVVADGLSSVPHDTVAAAEAMGYRGWQRLLLVELPVAVPVIAAGLRVAVVSNVSIVTMAALLGIPQLGSLFTQGFQLRLFAPLVVGVVLCVVLAVIFDGLIAQTIRCSNTSISLRPRPRKWVAGNTPVRAAEIRCATRNAAPRIRRVHPSPAAPARAPAPAARFPRSGRHSGKTPTARQRRGPGG